MLVEAVLDLERVDVLAAADDEVAQAGGDVQDAVLEPAVVAGADPTTGHDRVGVGLRVVVVADHHLPAARLDVAGFSVGQLVAEVVGDADPHSRQRQPHGVGGDAQHPVGGQAQQAVRSAEFITVEGSSRFPAAAPRTAAA